MTKDNRPAMWNRPDVTLAAVRSLERYRTEVRTQLLAYGHDLAPFRPTYSVATGGRTTALHAQTRCAACGIWIILNCVNATSACAIAPESMAALAPCAGRRAPD